MITYGDGYMLLKRGAAIKAMVIMICVGAAFLSGCGAKTVDGDPAAERFFTVTAAEAGYENLENRLEFSGELAALRQAVVVPSLPGRVAEIAVKEGQRVSKGQLLIRMDNTQQELQLKQAEIAVAAGRVEVEKLTYLVEQGAIAAQALRAAQAELEQGEVALELARYAYDVTFLRAPLTGVIGYIWAREGELVGNTQVVLIMDLDKVVVQLAVDEAMLVHLAPEMPVQVEVPAVGGVPRAGVITTIGQGAVPGSRSFPVQVEVDNAGGELKPGMFARVTVESEQRRAIMVPGSALREAAGRATLFVVSNHRVKEREVETGLRLEGRVEIRHGLNAGEQYVVRIPAGMQDGAAVEIGEE